MATKKYHLMRVVKKSLEGCVWRKASRSPFSQPGYKDKMGEGRAAILGRPKIDRVFLKNHPGSDFFTTPLIVILGFILVILIFYFLTPARDYLSLNGFAQLEEWIQAKGFWAPFIFGSIYVAACIFALPGSVLTIGGGLLFGTLWGTILSWISASLGASLSFLIVRYLGRDFVARFLLRRPLLNRLDEKIGTHGFYSVLFLRLIPLFPFNGLNFGLGLTKASFRDYAFATILGMLPGTFVYTSLGAAGRHLNFSDPATWTELQVWGPFVLVLLLALLPKFFKKSPRFGHIGTGGKWKKIA